MMNRRTVIAVVAAFAASCAAKEASRDSVPAEASTGEVFETEGGKQLTDERAQAERSVTGVDDLVRKLNEFAFDLYRSTRTEQFAISPVGVANLLSVAQAGAEGASAAQIGQTLRYGSDEANVHEKFRQLHDALSERVEREGRGSGRGFRFRSHSNVWVTPRLSVSAPFLATATNQHAAEVETIDFGGTATDVGSKINQRIREATGGRFEGLVHSPGPLTRLLLTNVVHWDAPWTLPFERGLTQDADFDGASGPGRVPMMHGRMRVGYLDGDGFQVVELPYADGQVSAWVILPDEDKPDFDAGLTADFFAWMLQSAKQQEVDVRIPRFEIGSRHALKSVLSTMGMPDVFDPAKASLGGVSPRDAEVVVYLDDVVHGTHISFDEDGTHAAANTRGSVATGQPAARFEATRPFVVIVRDAPTGAILAMARVSNP